MPASLRGLLGDAALELALLVDAPSVDAPISWAHSSDLADPTPFLSPDQLLLTTGTQFLAAEADPAAVADAYVARLVSAGVVALGFGTDVVRAGTPPDLVSACGRHRLPLVEVPYRVPFIAIVRRVADTIAHEAHARAEWSFEAQRAVSLAALGPAGLDDALRALADRLDRDVLLLDATAATAVDSRPSPSPPAAPIIAEAERMLARGTRASSSLDEGPRTVALQTLGRRDRLTGVLVVIGAGPLDAAANAVVTGAVALTEVVLETRRALRRSTAALRAHLFDMLLAGDDDRARGVATALGEPLPADPVVVVRVAEAEDGSPRVAALLERLHASGTRMLLTSGSVAHGTRTSGATAVLAASDPTVEAIAAACAESGGRAGFSRPTPIGRTAAATAEADAALARTAAGDARRLGGTTLTDFLADPEAALLAAERLSPVLLVPNGRDLVAAAEAWLRHNTQWEPAARELGLHRHSLKSRIERLATLLELDLDDFAGRVELWSIIRAAAPAREAAPRRTGRADGPSRPQPSQ